MHDWRRDDQGIRVVVQEGYGGEVSDAPLTVTEIPDCKPLYTG